MSDQEDQSTGANPSAKAGRPAQPSAHSSLESHAPTLDTIGLELSPDFSEDDDSSVSAEMEETSPGRSTKPSSARIKADPEDSGTGEQDLSSTGGPSMPVQKRRRVTRACDECRRKKIKCDGKQPCTHCSVYSYGKDHIRPLSCPLEKQLLADTDEYRMHI